MIKNFITNGCSFTQTPPEQPNWSVFAHRCIPDLENYVNLAKSGAGNDYIADSTIRYLSDAGHDPENTLVMIMWSGVSRLDVRVSHEFWSIMPEWSSKTQFLGVNYVFSGGMGSVWPTIPKSLFENMYMSMDYKALARNSLSRMVELRHFLENHGYKYKFMSYLNYWTPQHDYYSGNLDFSVSHYAQGDPLLKKLGDNWIWANDKKDCFFEFAESRNLLSDDRFHPNAEGHELFFNEVLKPHIQGLIS